MSEPPREMGGGLGLSSDDEDEAEEHPTRNRNDAEMHSNHRSRIVDLDEESLLRHFCLEEESKTIVVKNCCLSKTFS